MFDDVDGCPDCDGLDATKCACDTCGECKNMLDYCPHCSGAGHMCFGKHGCDAESDHELVQEVMSYSFDDSEEFQYGVGGERHR